MSSWAFWIPHLILRSAPLKRCVPRILSPTFTTAVGDMNISHQKCKSVDSNPRFGLPGMSQAAALRSIHLTDVILERPAPVCFGSPLWIAASRPFLSAPPTTLITLPHHVGEFSCQPVQMVQSRHHKSGQLACADCTQSTRYHQHCTIAESRE